MGKIKLFPVPEYSSKQPSDPVVPLVPCTGIFLGPSKSGKTVTLISLILEQYRGVFERIYIFSPSIDIDDGWIPVKKYIEEDLGVNTERQPAAAQDHGGVQEAGDEETVPGPDNLRRPCGRASAPQTQRRPGHSLHQGPSHADKHLGELAEAAAHQRSRAGQPAILWCWRLRNQHELDAVVEELSALLPKEQLYQLYEQATREPCATPDLSG